MKKLVIKISSIILSLGVLFSSMSFTIDEHYCGDMLMNVSYFGVAEKCGIEKINMSPQTTNIKKNNCCKDEVILIDSSVFNKEKVFNLDYVDLKFIFFYSLSYIDFYRSIDLEKEYYKDFSPPDPEQNIQALLQTFLI